MGSRFRRSAERSSHLALLAGLGFAAAAAGAEPTLAEAMSAPAANLAQGYLHCRYLIENVLPFAESGVAATIHIGGEVVTANNASEVKQRFEQRKAIYMQAMGERGFEILEGEYVTAASKPCARAGSFWMSVVQSEPDAKVTIRQVDHDATLSVSLEIEGKVREVSNDAAIVENAIVVMDGMNTDYYAVGELTDDGVRIRPDPRVLDGWPGWAAPPKRKDLLGCTVTLTRASAD